MIISHLNTDLVFLSFNKFYNLNIWKENILAENTLINKADVTPHEKKESEKIAEPEVEAITANTTNRNPTRIEKSSEENIEMNQRAEKNIKKRRLRREQAAVRKLSTISIE